MRISPKDTSPPLRRRRELGFSLEEVCALLGLVDGGKYTCAEVRDLTLAHLADVRRKIADLRRLEHSLQGMAERCTGDRVPACPIIDVLWKGIAQDRGSGVLEPLRRRSRHHAVSGILRRCGNRRDRRLLRVLGLAPARPLATLARSRLRQSALLAVLLTRIDSAFVGRAYAAYGGIYMAASLAWPWVIEGQRPDCWDLAGAMLCLGGSAVILWGPRAA